MISNSIQFVCTLTLVIACCDIEDGVDRCSRSQCLNTVQITAFSVGLASSEYVDFLVADSNEFEYDNEAFIGSCGEGQFECRNGDCIQREQLCDGKANCSDQSDETQSECTRLICPNRAFRCDYGACVQESAICNGVKDCLDNSDELLPKCPKTFSKLARVPQTLFFTIYDEQRERKITSKPPRIYRLRIPKSELRRTLALGKLEPSGLSNALTPYRQFAVKALTPYTSFVPLTPLTTLISSMPPFTAFCLVPPQPLNGQWKLHRDFCKGDENCDIPQGISLQPGSLLVYACSRNYMPRGNTDVHCGEGGNWSEIPVCVVTTCPPLNSVSRAATCSRFGNRVSCRSPVLPYTRARVTCRANYGPDPIFSAPFIEQSVLCHLDGTWGPEPITCSPACGVVDDSSLRLTITNGSATEVGVFPWHANLWKEAITPEGPNVQFRCSATIVQTNFVVTAAHCVVDDVLGLTEDPTTLRVTVGNNFRDPNGPQDTPLTVLKVKNVFRYCENFGFTHNYISDIALIELLNPIQFSSSVLPACLDVSRYSEEFFRPGVPGRITGFGRRSVSTPSPVLQTVKVTYVPNRECRVPYSPAGGGVAISDDEFCSIYSNESTICDWDSGGGFVALKGGLWHLMGIFIMDLGPQDFATTCGENPYSLYTKVSPYMSWIQDLMFQLRRYKTYPVCNFRPTSPATPVPTISSRWTTTTMPSVTSDPPTTVEPPFPVTLDPVDIRTSAPVSRFSCLVPPQPTNGEWQLHPDFCNSTDCSLPDGALLDPGKQLVYRCDPGFRIQGNADVFCSARGRLSPLPTCIEITCSSLETVSRSVTCYQLNAWVPCNATALPNTRAVIKCRVGYREDTSTLKIGSDTVECNLAGEWEPNPITCVPVCGMKNTRLTPTILNGTSADITEFPWHATLYRQMNVTQGSKEFICGATIIQDNLLMTAAHCVYDDRFKTIEIPELFSVAAGNKFRDYDSPLHDPRVVQKSAVKNIYVPCEYFGLEGNYASDIALIELREPFQLSDILSPACLDVVGNNDQILEAGSVGQFAGFGRTSLGASSAVLLSANIPYVSFSQCKMSQTGDGNVALIGKDKFCGGTINGMAVCQGDSGGGLTFNNGGASYVMGVLSVNLGVDTSSGERTCDGNAYSLYTKVSDHMPWIRKVMFDLEKDKAHSSCGSK